MLFESCTSKKVKKQSHIVKSITNEEPLPVWKIVSLSNGKGLQTQTH